ncbi:hypothetical protein BUALT_Bualt17G0098500 [Buddleja alternifolia]|uniref:Non-specific lipid-transfer protein n=1 Tax=Buddleja alternifolia TaxID=168488 RepID=A0AAV6W8Y4_9LAMI|nr:hypothetical protein BUALT_Bualt17G0098500 [Buddleja alternifolia]
MAKLSMVAVMVLVCLVVVALAPDAEGSITCQKVVNSLLPCRTYMKQGGSLPSACCNGVRSLNNAARGTADRRTACGCIKVAAKALRVNVKYAADVPAKCKVNIGYPISYNTDCNM